MPDKPDLARGWRFVEKLLLEEDLARLDETGDEEVHRQMRAAGIEPEHVPTAEELIAHATDRARGGDGERRGVEARAIAPLPAPPRRTAWAVGLAAAAIGAMAVVVVVEKKEVVAWFQKEPVKTPPDVEDVQKPPTPLERAAALRDAAFTACGEGYWAECRRHLDEAKQLDPGGESDLRVKGSRKAVEDALHPDDGRELRGPK